MQKDISARARANKAARNSYVAGAEIISLTRTVMQMASDLKKTADSFYELRERVSDMDIKIKELEGRL